MQTIKVIYVACIMLFCTVLNAQTSPIPTLENAANEVINTLKKNKGNLKNNPKIIQQAVQLHLVPIVDVNGMSRSVIGREAWNKANAQERQDFSNAFKELVIRTYANPLAEYSGETIKFLPIRGSLDEHFVKVNSEIKRPNGQRIPLSYSLVSKNNQWKIYDFSIEGVSLLQSFRQQFAGVLKNSSLGEVTRQMRQKKVA